MVNTRFIHFRVTREQYATIKTNASNAGYKTVSSFLRKLALADSPDIQRTLTKLEEDFQKTYALLKSVFGERTN
jgi:uncharacterized protein (DUF1778 family)